MSSYQVCETRCRGGATASSIQTEQAAILYFLERVEFALRTWHDHDIDVHITSVALVFINGDVRTIGSIDIRCRHQAISRAKRRA